MATAESVEPAQPTCLMAALIKRWYHRRTRLYLRFVGDLDKPKPCESAEGLHFSGFVGFSSGCSFTEQCR